MGGVAIPELLVGIALVGLLVGSLAGLGIVKGPSANVVPYDIAISGGKINAPPTSPPTGAASLVLNSPNCSSFGLPPTCRVNRKWDPLQKAAIANPLSFGVTGGNTDRTVVEGIYDLTILNSGFPSTTLSSIIIDLEKSVSNQGNAPGPSGKNWLIVATGVASAGNSLCNTPVLPIANICSDSNSNTSVTMSSTTNSSVVVKDANDNSIASLESVVIPTSNCSNPTRLRVYYSLGLTPSQAAALAGASVRINVMVTFQTIGSRGGTCSADVNCDGTIASNEIYVRTVQDRTTFTFPSSCPYNCRCVDETDVASQVSLEYPANTSYSGSDDLPEVTHTPYNPVSNPMCAAGNFSFGTNESYVCPELHQALLTTVTDVVNLAPAQSEPSSCVDIFGASLLPPPASASYHFVCPQTIEDPIEPTPTPTDGGGGEDHFPPVGEICSYTRGIFGQTCKGKALLQTVIQTCNNRRNSTGNPGCIIDKCTASMYPYTFFDVTATLAANYYYQRRLAPNLYSDLDEMIRLFVTSNLGTPKNFDSSFVYTSLSTPMSYATSAGNFAAQLTTALYNRDLTLTFDSSARIALFNQLTFKASACGGLPAWVRGLTLNQVIDMSRCIISLPFDSSMNTASGFSLVCSDKCSNVDGYLSICSALSTTYTAPSFADVNGQTIFSGCNSAMDHYNTGFDACNSVPECLVLPPS